MMFDLYNIGDKVSIDWALERGIGEIIQIKNSYPYNDFFYKVRFNSSEELWGEYNEIVSLAEYRKQKLINIKAYEN